MHSARRYLAIVQDARGYPPPGELDPAPPEGPGQPMVYSVVKADDFERVQAERDEAIRLLANATDPENEADWEEAREAGWAFARERDDA